MITTIHLTTIARGTISGRGRWSTTIYLTTSGYETTSGRERWLQQFI